MALFAPHMQAALAEARAAAAPVIGDDGDLVGILAQKDCFRPALHAKVQIANRQWFLANEGLEADKEIAAAYAARATGGVTIDIMPK